MRIILLGKFFTETTSKLVVAMIKSKKDQKKVQKVQMIDADIKEAVLSRYLSKCKYKHASLFFEWRRKRRRVRVMKCVEVLANLRLKINFMEEG